MRASQIVMAYFVIGVTMFGGGAIAFSETGVATWVVDYNTTAGTVSPSNNTTENVEGTGGAIESIVNLAVGTVLLVWNLFVALVAFMHWPILVLYSNSAPPVATMLFGGGFTLAFYLSLIRLVRTSA